MAGERTKRLEHDVEHWRGAAGALAREVQVLAHDMDAEADGSTTTSRVSVQFQDGHESWGSVKEFIEDLDARGIATAKVRSIRFNVDRADPTRLALIVSVSSSTGLSVVVEGERDLLVHGLMEEAKVWAEKGRVPPRLSQRRALTLGERIGAGVVLALLPGIQIAFFYANGKSWGIFPVGLGLLIWTIAIPLAGLQIALEPMYPEAPALVLLKTEEEEEPEVEAEPPGLIARAEGWVGEHRAIAFAITITVTVVLNIAANALYDTFKP